MRKVSKKRIKDKRMDWTQIILAVVATSGTIGTVVLPITLSRSHKKTRELNDEGNRDIGQRIGHLETAVNGLTDQMGKTGVATQGILLREMIEHRPHQWETIRQAFAAYSTAGGNGYVQRMYDAWEADFGQYFDRGEVPPSLINKTA